MSPVRILAPCLIVALGVILYAWWPSADPEPEPARTEAATAQMWTIFGEQERARAAGLLAGGLLPAVYDDGRPPAYVFSTAPLASASTR